MRTTGTLPLVFAALLATGCGRDYEVTKPSGLAYTDLSVGEGREAKAGDFIEVHYEGWLNADNSKFDSSRDAKSPMVFLLGTGGHVIRGWDDGIAGMKAGGKRKLFIPAKLAYGATGRGIHIPPNADLVFEIELLRILDGVQSEDLAVGQTMEVKWDDIVKVRFTGRLKEGGEPFDSNVDHPEPYEFHVGEGKVIKGWEAGVLGMKVGGKRKLTIPAELAFGATGVPMKVPPNADVVFEIELLSLSRKGTEP